MEIGKVKGMAVGYRRGSPEQPKTTKGAAAYIGI